jgi:redox-sensitive bicupin YhaK (pirin superfamily)
MVPLGPIAEVCRHEIDKTAQLCRQVTAARTACRTAYRTPYLHVVSGLIVVNGEQLSEGDGATITETDSIRFEAVESAEALLFDLAQTG